MYIDVYIYIYKDVMPKNQRQCPPLQQHPTQVIEICHQQHETVIFLEQHKTGPRTDTAPLRIAHRRRAGGGRGHDWNEWSGAWCARVSTWEFR